MINRCFSVSLLILFWVSQYNASAFLPAATYRGRRVLSNAARRRVFSKRQICQKSPLKLDDNPDGNRLENLTHLSNVTASVTTKDYVTNNNDTPNNFEEGKDTDFSAARLGRSNWTRNFYEYANAAAGTLGDIMSRKPEDDSDPNAELSTTSTTADGNVPSGVPPSGADGLVTTAIPSGSLASRFGIEHPLDRMALTANGNLQRLVSSYYDAPVQVVVDACDKMMPQSSGGALVKNTNNTDETDFMVADNTGIKRPYAVQTTNQWDRVVHLSVHNQTFCTAHSVITVHDPICQELVESGEIGIGQLFRYLDILPEFELHNAGLHPKDHPGGFWREYTLRCAELSCDIREDFRSGMWEIKPIVSSAL